MYRMPARFAASDSDEIEELQLQVPNWKLVERESTLRLERIFRFNNFAEALSFTNRVGALAEAEGHHPAILTEWGQVTVTLWTHPIRGLHRNDFIMAAKIDSLVAAPWKSRRLAAVCASAACQSRAGRWRSCFRRAAKRS